MLDHDPAPPAVFSDPPESLAERQAALSAALVGAQAAFPAIPRDKTVQVRTKDGGSYSFNYAPLDSILALVRPVLAEHGFAIVQLLEPGPALRTELRHKEGGVLGASFPFQAPPEPQALGSLLTYLRRYALVALLGIAAEEDDDGNRASGNEVSSLESRPATDKQKGYLEKLIGDADKAGRNAPGGGKWFDFFQARTAVADLSASQASLAIEIFKGANPEARASDLDAALAPAADDDIPF